MENAETILVIILSCFLAIFLLLGIILLGKTIQWINQLKRITDKAEAMVDKAESIGELLKKAGGSFAVGRLLTNIAATIFNRDSKTSKKRGG